jgi:FAD/FMN-containing dehydrogenase
VLYACSDAEQRQFTEALRDFPDSVLSRASRHVSALPVQDVNLDEGSAVGTSPISPAPTLEQKLELWRDIRRRSSANICGCKVSLLPSKLGDVLPRLEAEAGRRTFESALLAHAGAGVTLWCFRGAAIADGGLPPFADWLRAEVRAANGWVVFDSLPLHSKDRIDPWDSDVPGLGLMRGIKQALDPARRLSPGRFVGDI